jgi:prepilin-type N-terminal cleavage/methylation domain-containing protein
MTQRSPIPARPLRRPATRAAGRRGFTLTELLVVIGIIVLLLALAVPLFNVLRGGRSVDSGQNVVSAMLQRARARAIWTQQTRGILFFDDQATHRTGMLMVKYRDDAVNTLDLDDDNVEMELLPTGIGMAFALPGSPRTDYHPVGLILFDGVGRIQTSTYQVKPATKTNLVDQYGPNLGDDLIKNLGVSPKQEFSEAAFVLYDQRKFADQGPILASGFTTQQQDWLDQDATAIVMNRYNGTLIRGD